MPTTDAYFNHDTEACALGAALQNERAARLVASTPETAFHDTGHQLVHRAIMTLVMERRAVDLMTVDAWLGEKGLLAAVGGTSALMNMISRTPAPSNIDSYLEAINTLSSRRNLYRVGFELMNRAKAGGEPEEMREWAARAIRESRTGDAVRLITMEDAMLTTYDQLNEDQHREGKTDKRINTGIDSLDEVIGGLRGGEYVAIGARPSVGKSILALTMCVNAAKQGKKVLLVSLEMSETQITERVLADQSNVALHVITSGHIPREAWEGMAQSIDPIVRLPLWYCLEASTVEKVRTAAWQLYEKGGLDMIAIDYLQLMEATYSRKQNRQEQIAEISRGLRLLAQELKIPVLVLTQLNRASVKNTAGGKTQREPTMSEARESGAIEQDANIFMLLHNPTREEMKTETEKAAYDEVRKQGHTLMRIIIDKNRQGKRGKIFVAFDGDHMRFLPISKGEKP